MFDILKYIYYALDFMIIKKNFITINGVVLLLILPKKYIIVYPTASLHEGKDVKKCTAKMQLHDCMIDILK